MSAVPVSVVIICYNAAATIRQTVASALRLTNDIIVVDSGSTDGTQAIVEGTGAVLLEAGWKGFGANKNRGNEAAKWDWILSIDADEELSTELIAAIKAAEFSNPNIVYSIKRLNYLSGQPLYFGDWRNDWTMRLFNRTVIHWEDVPVHEKLLVPAAVQQVKLKGWLHHYTAANINEYNRKLETYASLVAKKYFAKGEKAVGLKIYASPVFTFFKSYFLYGGWLDKKRGWQIAVAHARYTFKKYKKLSALRREKVLVS